MNCDVENCAICKPDPMSCHQCDPGFGVFNKKCIIEIKNCGEYANENTCLTCTNGNTAVNNVCPAAILHCIVYD